MCGVIARLSSEVHIFRYEYNESVIVKYQIVSLLYPVTEVIDFSGSFGLMLLIYVDLGATSHLSVTEIVLQAILCLYVYYILIEIFHYQ